MELEPHGVVARDHGLGEVVGLTGADTAERRGQQRLVATIAVERTCQVGHHRCCLAVDLRQIGDCGSVVVGIGVVVDDRLAVLVRPELPTGAEVEEALVERSELLIGAAQDRTGTRGVHLAGQALVEIDTACRRELKALQPSVPAKHESFPEGSSQLGLHGGGREAGPVDESFRLGDAGQPQSEQHQRPAVRCDSHSASPIGARLRPARRRSGWRPGEHGAGREKARSAQAPLAVAHRRVRR